MLIIESVTATITATATPVRFSSGGFDPISKRLSHSGSFFLPRSKVQGVTDDTCGRQSKFRVRASVEEKSSSDSGPVKPNGKPHRYHPFEDISDSELVDSDETRLTPAETSRTVIEVNSKATLMFSGLISDEVHENIFWPNLPYVTDEYGSIYFQVKNDEDVLQILTTEDNRVQVIIGLDTTELLNEIESLGEAEIDFGVEEIDDEDSDVDDEIDEDDDEDGGDEDDNQEKDWVAILEDEEDTDNADESLGDWANLATMHSSHPIYFAKKLVEVVSDDPVDFLDQPPAGLAIQGLLRPAFIEEQSVIQKHISENLSCKDDVDQISKVENDSKEKPIIISSYKHDPDSSQDRPADELEKDEGLGYGTSFYKLEMIKIQLIAAHGHQELLGLLIYYNCTSKGRTSEVICLIALQSFVEVGDFTRAKPDSIAHSAAKIISRVRAGGEKIMQALQALCWRCKGIQVEEVALIGVDSLGFDLRVCSGTQVQTLHFAFKKRASSEYSAERQLHALLFPKVNNKLHKRKEAQQTEL